MAVVEALGSHPPIHLLFGLLLSFAGPALVSAGELAFVDVSADDSINLRSLDVVVSYARGVENFFAADPMTSHDWADMNTLRNSLDSVLTAAQGTGTTAKTVTELEEALRVTYSALPKNEYGRVSNETARYALHRLFVARHGWTLKGLEPAGSSWHKSMQITRDVKQASKYIVPTFIISEIADRESGRGLDLRLLATIAALLLHVIRSELMELLYKISVLLELPVNGPKTESQLKDIVTTFMMVYAFGIDLEVSSAKDFVRAKEYLESHHLGWRDMQGLLGETLGEHLAGASDYAGVLAVVTRLGERYSAWQSRDCTRARRELAAMPTLEAGRVPLADLSTSESSGFRTLFAESNKTLGQFAALDESDPARPTLIVPNYINSHSLCLTTASYYMVCCPNVCEALLGRLEERIASPAAAPEELERLLREAASSPGSPSPLPRPAEPLLAELKDVAKQPGGDKVALHGRPFAAWLHKAFPLDCPAPQDKQVLTSPKTADEWMASDDDVSDVEALIVEIGDVLSRYAVMGLREGENVTADVEEEGKSYFEGPEVVRMRPLASWHSTEEEVLRQRRGLCARLWSVFRAVFQLAILASVGTGMIALVVRAAKEYAGAAGPSKGRSLGAFAGSPSHGSRPASFGQFR